MKRKKTETTRIKCSCGEGKFHKVEFLQDGRVVSSGCGDVTQQARTISTMMRLGAWKGDTGSCAALGALVLDGCEMILRRPGDEDNVVSIDGWRDIYIRFETIGVVERKMSRVRRRLRKERRDAMKETA